MLQTPFLLIRDPKLISSILVADFEYFTDRIFYMNEKVEPLTVHLFALGGQRWRDLRDPPNLFTPNRMKLIFPGLFDCGTQLQKHLFNVVDGNQAIEISEIMACFASNIVTSTAFGVDIDCFVNPNHPTQNG